VCRCPLRPGLITPEARKRKKADHVRFERARSMELWQMDIVGGVHAAVDSPEAKVVTAVSDGPAARCRVARPVWATPGSARWRSAEVARSRAISSRCVRGGNATPSPSPSSTGTSATRPAAACRAFRGARSGARVLGQLRRRARDPNRRSGASRSQIVSAPP
jgi:hypothetical protein